MKKTIIACCVALAIASLSGCSASALTGLIGSKPDLTAQVGAENVKQGVGVSNKTDTSSKQETAIKDSSVGQVDTSSKKTVSTSSISAETIKADKIEIRNQGGGDIAGWVALAGMVAMALLLGAAVFRKRNKGA